MAVFGEVVDYYIRQKYSVALEIFFGLSGVCVGLVYLAFGQWRIITGCFILLPAVVQLFMLIFYLEETPKFLIKKGKDIAIKSLNRVGKINLGEDELVTEEDIDSVIEA